MQRSTATATVPLAISRRNRWSGMAAQAAPASNANPKTGMYKNLSAMSRAIGIIQFDTGSNATKKKRMPKVTAGRVLRKRAAVTIEPTTKASPSHASQSPGRAMGMELKS